jgi:PAS domain S-box-containing protein
MQTENGLRYWHLIDAYIKQPHERYLLAAADLGRELMQAGLPPEGLAEIHHLVLEKLGQTYPDLTLSAAAQLTAVPFIEAMMAYGIAFREQIAIRERHGRANLEAVTEQSRDLIVITDRQGLVEYVNPAFLKTTGYTINECLGSTPSKLVNSGHQLPAVYRELWRTIETGDVWQGRLIDRNKQGDLFVVDVNVFPLENYAGQIVNYVSISRDITERVAIERTVQEKTQRLEAVATLAAGIAHDAKNLLGVILGYADLVAADVTDTLSRNNLEQIKLAANRSRDLVLQILAFARQDQDEEQPNDVRVLDVAQEVLSLIRISCTPDLKLDVHEHFPGASVSIRRSHLTQVLMNLALNAEQAMEFKNGTLDIIIDQCKIPPAGLGLPLLSGGYICIQVIDNGPGIPENLQHRIFDPFFTTKKETGGTGLGLSVTRNIIENYHGAIDLWSRQGQGTRFTIILPTSQPADNQQSTQKTIHITPAPPVDNQVALIVDDDTTQLTLIKKMAAKVNIQTLVTDNPWAALKAFHKNPKRFFAVVTDQWMPELEGISLAQHMLDVNPQLSIILYTADPEMVDEIKLKTIGIRQFLVKPIDYRALMELLKSYRDGN